MSFVVVLLGQNSDDLVTNQIIEKNESTKMKVVLYNFNHEEID